jgi:hypothetical protein
LEQIDVSINLIEKYSDDFQLCRTADDVEDAIRGGRIASLFGLEGYVALILFGVVRLMIVLILLVILLEVSSPKFGLR